MVARKESRYGSSAASGGRRDRTAGPQHVEALIEAYAPLVKYIAHRLA
jgi:DNA-directed RNA polymerase specialized sigma subunit